MAIYYPMTGPYSYSAALREEFFAQWQRERPRYVAAIYDLSAYGEHVELARKFCERMGSILERQYVFEAAFPPLPKTAQGTGDNQPRILIFRRKSAD